MKALIEKRNDLKTKAEAIVNTAKAENRAITAEEKATFDGYIADIASVDATIKAGETLDGIQSLDYVPQSKPVSDEQKDVTNFASYIRNRVNGIVDTASQLTKGDNGAVVPSSIANKIIARVVEISPIYAKATKYNVKGTLTIPKVDSSTDDITVGYANEFATPDSHSFALGSVSLTGFLTQALTLVSKSLINNSDFDLVNYVVNRMSEKIAIWIDGELINGTADKVAGIARSYDSTGMKITLAKKSTVTVDDLINIQDAVPDIYQPDCMWVMKKATRKAIRKLKDSDGEYLLQKDITNGFGYSILGKPVYTTESAPALGTTGNLAIVYGDMSGLAVKEPVGLETQIFAEKYADQHAIGVQAWLELDAKVENVDKIACGACGASDA